MREREFPSVGVCPDYNCLSVCLSDRTGVVTGVTRWQVHAQLSRLGDSGFPNFFFYSGFSRERELGVEHFLRSFGPLEAEPQKVAAPWRNGAHR